MKNRAEAALKSRVRQQKLKNHLTRQYGFHLA
jgi:hypothetical protein